MAASPAQTRFGGIGRHVGSRGVRCPGRPGAGGWAQLCAGSHRMLFPKLQPSPSPAANGVPRSTVGWAPSCQRCSGCPAPSVVPASEHTFVFTSFTESSCGDCLRRHLREACVPARHPRLPRSASEPRGRWLSFREGPLLPACESAFTGHVGQTCARGASAELTVSVCRY